MGKLVNLEEKRRTRGVKESEAGKSGKCVVHDISEHRFSSLDADRQSEIFTEWLEDVEEESEMLMILERVLSEWVERGVLTREQVVLTQREAVRYRTYLKELDREDMDAYGTIIASAPRDEIGVVRRPNDRILLTDSDRERYIGDISKAYEKRIGDMESFLRKHENDEEMTDELMGHLRAGLEGLKEEYEKRKGK